jgi:hypothetical protein
MRRRPASGGLTSRDRATWVPDPPDNVIRAGTPPVRWDRPGFNVHKCLVVYNTDVSWSEAGADYWAEKHGVVSHKLGFPLGASVPSADTLLDGTSDNYASIRQPIYDYCVANQIDAVFAAPGTPMTMRLLRSGGGGDTTINFPSYLGSIRYLTEWATTYQPLYGSPIELLCSALPATNPKPYWEPTGFAAQIDSDDRHNDLGYEQNLYHPSRSAGTLLARKTPRLSDGGIRVVVNQPSRTYASPPTYRPPASFPFMACGRIGRPRFGADADLPTETLALATAVIDQAVANERNLDQIRREGLALELGVSTRVAGSMPDEEITTIYDYARSLGLNANYWTKDLTSTFSTTLTPASGEAYSRASLLGGGVVGRPCWAQLGYALENESIATAAVQAAYSYHPGAWCYEGTSFSYLHVGRLQKGGGIGGLAHTGEPLADDAGGVWQFFYNLMHGMTLAEAHFRGTHQMPWQSSVVGDPLYRPFGGPEP